MLLVVLLQALRHRRRRGRNSAATRLPLSLRPRCGSLLSPLTQAPAVQGAAFAGLAAGVAGPAAAKVVCRLCGGGARHIERVGMPFVFKYLATELAAMNIKVAVTLR